MARLLSTVTALTALAAAPAHARAQAQQQRFSEQQRHGSTAAAAASAWAPTAVSSTIQLGGSLTRSSATYSLEKRDSSSQGQDSRRWTTAVKGAHQGGWVEATTGKGAAKRKIEMLPAAVHE